MTINYHEEVGGSSSYPYEHIIFIKVNSESYQVIVDLPKLILPSFEDMELVEVVTRKITRYPTIIRYKRDFDINNPKAYIFLIT